MEYNREGGRRGKGRRREVVRVFRSCMIWGEVGNGCEVR